MNHVFLLWHTHTFQSEEISDKLIGVFRTDADAQAAIQRLSDKPGFCDEPMGFSIVDYPLNVEHWVEGYVTEK
jgi:hypothetical protein